ncbi:MAG TPA: hypothetical protein VGO56_03260 [Pyrinomonadaceae bacterium]|jgi:hypothetical protein|nr:hypothetical protein [Pyrinomonadaceae bacterium]
MKRAAFVCTSLILAVILLPTARANSAQADTSFPSFWASFKLAVIKGNSKTIGNLSRFPIGVSAPANEIKDRSELRERFNELFVIPEKVNASECFAQNEPTRDTENNEIFTVTCRYNKGSDAAAYQFEHTKVGWRFTHFQLSTTCRCR